MPEPNFIQIINMNQLTNFIHKIDFSVTNDASLSQSKRKYRFEKCNECKKRRKPFEKDHNICRACYRSNTIFKPIGNEIIDDFIRYTQCNRLENYGKMECVPYDQFKDIEFIAEGGFSRVYKATWVDGPIKNGWENWNKVEQRYRREANKQVALRKLNNSKNITSKELNEVQNISYFYILYINE